jgi:hypothetical protein
MCRSSLTATLVLAALGLGPAASAAEPGPSLSSPPWVASSGQGVGLGVENGLWSHQFGSGVRARVPLGQTLALNLRGIVLHGFEGDASRTDLVGRLDLCGGPPVVLNVLRPYGCAGGSVGRRLAGPGDPALTYGFGGLVGLETFFGPRLSLYIEIGGNGGNVDAQSGGTAVGGLLFYLR